MNRHWLVPTMAEGSAASPSPPLQARPRSDAALQQEEQRRFELLVAHWDVPLNRLDLSTRKPSR
jgi:hypothetical protein